MTADSQISCGSGRLLLYEDSISNNQVLDQHQSLRSWIQNFESQGANQIMNNTVYTVPVVFHILHLGENIGTGSNISDAEVLATLDQLNDDFANVSTDGYDPGIQFCLARRSPQGDTTSGINRIDASIINSYNQDGITLDNEVEVKALSIWEPLEYLNVWIVHEIDIFNDPNVLGFSRLPYSVNLNVDGVVIRDDAGGTSANSKVITHEVGHYFGLYHTFFPAEDPGITSCLNLDDFIDDTRAHTYNQVIQESGQCSGNDYDNCDNGTYPYRVDKNHMNYSNNSCRTIFTEDQAMRMRAILMSLRRN